MQRTRKRECEEKRRSSQGLMHIDGDVPLCIRFNNKDAGMRSKEIERARGEGGGRHHYRHVESDVPLCMRKKVDENEAKSKENEDNTN